MLENSERSVRGVRMGKSGPLERAELANQIQGLRILDRWDASEKNNVWYQEISWWYLYSFRALFVLYEAVLDNNLDYFYHVWFCSMVKP